MEGVGGAGADILKVVRYFPKAKNKPCIYKGKDVLVMDFVIF
jgi:hypothetical protein